MFGWEYPPVHSGGLGVACQGLVRGLLKNNVKVTLVLPHHGGVKDHDNLHIRSPHDEHMSIVTVPSILQPYDTIDEYEMRIHLSSLPRETSELYGKDLGEAVERFTAMAIPMTKDVHADVIHCHDWMTYDAGARAAKHHGKPLVAHIHATELDRTHFQPNEWIAARERKGLLAADRVIAVSGYTKDILTKHYGIPGDKISVVHNGHDHVQADPRSFLQARKGVKIPLVLFLGRLTVQKNPRQFLDVAKVIHEHRPDVQFVMAGDGGMLPSIVDQACDLGLSKCMVFTGKVSTREANNLFAQADCFVMPSVSEPFGLVALEAIGHGTPVVISKQSGVAEVLDAAFKIDFWDTDKMADCILTILREDPLASQLRSEAPRVLQRLTWKNQASKVHSIYSDILS